MKKPVLLIEKLHAAVNKLVAYIPTLDTELTQHKLEQDIRLDETLMKTLKERHGALHFENFVGALKKADSKKSLYHSKKLLKAIAYVRDDYPPVKGQDVYIKRYEHGFFKYGGWSGKIKEVFGGEGQKKSYTVTVLEEFGNSCNFDVHIAHTRDLRY